MTHYFCAKEDSEPTAVSFPSRFPQMDGNPVASDDTLAQPGNRHDPRIVYSRQER
jgi:hypothetical protein